MQFEDGRVQVLKRRELYLRPRRNLVQMRRQLGFDLVVVDAQANLLRGPRWHRDENQ